MIGYAVPSNRYHEFNVAAMAEWTWNANGRLPEEFARAYAVRTGIAEPEAFARWAALAGEAGWALAESGLFLTSIYDPSLGLGSNVPFDHRFQAAGISKLDEFDRMLDTAKKALDFARQSGNRDLVCESECALAGLEAFGLIRSASAALKTPAADEKTKNDLGNSLDKLDRCAETLRRACSNGTPACALDQCETKRGGCWTRRSSYCGPAMRSARRPPLSASPTRGPNAGSSNSNSGPPGISLHSATPRSPSTSAN